MATNENKPVDKMNYEEAQEELEQIVFRLEEEQHPLEATLAMFERGQALLQRCSDLLEKAELRIKNISAGALEDLADEP
jgi:exodeoxyribonuclease VII small subunit